MDAAAGKLTKFELPAPAFWGGLAFAAGIFAAFQLYNNLLFWFLFSLAAIGLAGFFHLRHKNARSNFGLLALFFGLGGLRYSAATDVLPGRSVANFAGLNRRIFISGEICELPEIQPSRSRIYLDQVAVGWRERLDLQGKIQVTIGQPVSGFSLGDRVELTGFLDSLWAPANPGSLDYARYLRIRGVQGSVYLKRARDLTLAARSSGGVRGHLVEARRYVERLLTRGLPPQAAGVISGFVLGDTRGIAPDVYELFKKTGTLHLLAVSGANVAWVALVPILLLKLFYLPLRWRYGAALAAVAIFVLLTDGQASVLRAALMFGFWTASKLAFRGLSGIQSLGLSALLLLTINPLWFFDIGFELSYLAAFALIYFSYAGPEPGRQGTFWSRLRPVLATPAVAFLATFPLLAFYFNRVTPVALFSNLLAVPLAMLVTWAAFLFGFLNLLGAGGWFSGVLNSLLDAMFGLQRFFTGHPAFHFAVPHPGGWATLLLFLAAFGALIFFFKAGRRRAGAYLTLAAGIPLVWLPGLRENPEYALSVLEARGEMISVLTLPGRTILIGGGRVDDKVQAPGPLPESYLTYLGRDGIDGYFPLQFDSPARRASQTVAAKFNPAFTGWPLGERAMAYAIDSAAASFKYLIAPGDSVPFGLHLTYRNLAFLFLPRRARVLPQDFDSILSGPTVVVAPLEYAQAESLSRRQNVSVLVSPARLYRLPQTVPEKLFFTFRDGMVTFTAEDGGIRATTYLTGRRLFAARSGPGR